ncbi:hypothetical protein NW762_014654 [Fusarium torreyae]|uniref:Carboxylic ester hydrolase n=1 Tax=Fusarium torreyae TaxID=1237075 RepID=A0A9W8V6F1_9HYPO|nr:hypothetical protein NW762_014654 [Fusarium torreyae]
MQLKACYVFTLISGLATWLAEDAYALSTTKVRTERGVIHGFKDKSYPHVAQFLGIPYAEPPTGKRRWAPAVPKRHFGTLDASAQGPACPQSEPVVGDWAAEFLIKPNSTSEDCLYLNVWAPFSPSKEKLPVVIWIHGGGFGAGGGDIVYQTPTPWVERSQKHIVVSLNYRLGVFGFPNAADLDPKEQNLGLLDQRLAVEWVRDNIANFGGDPERIVIWGQSAGAVSVGYYQYAWTKDPIARGYIQNSGGVFLNIGSPDPSHTNFTALAKAFGYTKGNEVDYLRRIPFKDIQRYVENGTGLGFTPVVDERTKFSDYAKRILSPKIPKLPLIIGSNRDEGDFGANINHTAGTPPYQVKPDSTFGCPAYYETSLRTKAGATTYRYEYSANFTNIMPKGLGAFHSAELPLIFGTHNAARAKSGQFEYDVSHAMQNYWLEFIQDPTGGPSKHGWDPTPAGQLNTIQKGVEFGFNNTIAVRKYDWASWQKGCKGATAV